MKGDMVILKDWGILLLGIRQPMSLNKPQMSAPI